MGSYKCCPHCVDAASDHVSHGGHVEKDGHDMPCSTCEYEQRTRPRLADAWDAGYRAAYLFERGEFHPERSNPYRAEATP